MEQACLARQGLIQVDFDQQFQITALRRDLDAILPLFDSVSAKPGEELTFGQLVDIETGELSPKLAELTASGRNFKVVVEPMPARLELRLPAVGRRPPV